MLYFRRVMNKLVHPAIVTALIIFLALSCTVIAFSTKPPVLNNSTEVVFLFQTTPTPLIEEDQSEVGSTDEIILLGGAIVIIVLIPIILQRKAWAQKKNA
jgi:hypothetical protein